MTSARFRRAARLRRSQDYRHVQGEGRKIRLSDVLVIYLPGQADESRYGITVSRKVGSAVTRNRVKRWLREAIRHKRLDARVRCDVVFIAHPSAAAVGLPGITAQVEAAMARIARESRIVLEAPCAP